MTTYRIIEATADSVTVFYEFLNGKQYQHTLKALTADAQATIAAIEAAGREFEAIYDPAEDAEETPKIAPEVAALIGNDVEIPTEGE